MRILLIALLTMVATQANAAWRIGLAALSHDASRAIIVYGNDWVEVDLRTGATTLLIPSVTCAWTSAVYAPQGRDFAMTAHCVADMNCDRVRTDVWIAHEGEALTNVVFVFGKRWNDAVWRPGLRGGEILVRETPVYTAVATGLNDLGSSGECDQGISRLASVSLNDGRVAAFDIAPRGWTVAAPLAATTDVIFSDLRAKAGSTGGSSAEAEIAALCTANPSQEDDWRASVCGDAGIELSFEWRDGDWLLLDTASSGPGRLIVSADTRTQVRETCSGEQVGGRLKARCLVEANGPSGTRTIEAPEGLFGDLAISGNGRHLASLAAGRGLNIRRFDLFDLETGEVIDLSPLLEFTPPWDARR